VYFRDAKNGWAVGFAGQILRSRDGGATWDAQTSPVKGWLTCVLFDGSNRGWITSDDGLLVSEDSGESWKSTPVDKRGFPQQADACERLALALGPFQALKQGEANVAWQKIEKLVPRPPTVPEQATPDTANRGWLR